MQVNRRRIIDPLRHGRLVRSIDVGIDLMYGRCQCGQYRLLRLRSANYDRKINVRLLIERIVNSGPDLRIQGTFSDVVDDTNNLLD